MSRAGLTVFNDNNILQIDDDYLNLALVLTVQLSFSQQYERVYSATVTVSGDSLVPVVGASSIFVSLLSLVVNADGTTRFTFIATSTGTANVSFFGIPTGEGALGLQTFDESGRLTYDSSRPYLDVVEVFDASTVYSNNYSVVSKVILGATSAGVLLPQFYGLKYLSVYPPEFPGDIWKGERWAEALFVRAAGNTAYFKSHIIFGSSAQVGALTEDWYQDSMTGPVLALNLPVQLL